MDQGRAHFTILGLYLTMLVILIAKESYVSSLKSCEILSDIKSAAVVKSDIKEPAPTLAGESRGPRLFLVFCYNNFLRETLLTLLVFFQFHLELHLRRVSTAGETNFLKETV